jgi:YidC/Oxa1 family membrane protein insertase
MRPYREHAALDLPTSTVPAQPTQQAAPPTTPDVEPPKPSHVVTAAQSGQPVVVETDLFRATIDSLGGRLRGFELKRYSATVAKDSPWLDLVQGDGPAMLPLSVDIGGIGSDAGVEYVANKTTFSLSGEQADSLVLTGALPNGSSIVKRFDFTGSSYTFELGVELSGSTDANAIAAVIVPLPTEQASAVAGTEKAIAFSAGKLVEQQMKAMTSETKRLDGALWAGFANRYFVSVVVSEQDTKTVVMGPVDGTPVVSVGETTKSGVARFKVLMGPKEPAVLQAAGNHLDRALDFGWFWFIAIPLLSLLRFFHAAIGNYGVAIILLTVLVKIATIPLTRAQYRSMQKMQKIQPELERLRQRQKDDPSAMQRDMMELYRKHGVNPFSGCVPMFLQIPIFVGLYNALLNAIELRHAPFVGWINDLSAPDHLMIAGVGIPVLVILMGASMLAQQWMTPMQGDPTQRRMMMFMPVIFTAMFLNFPSGLVLYWLVNNVISVAQQYAVMGGVKQGAQA